MEELLLTQTDQMCRTCMRCKESDSSSNAIEFNSVYDFVQDFQNRDIQIHELLNYTVPQIPIIEMVDALPKVICIDCLDKLKACYEFQNYCIKSDLQLRNAAGLVKFDQKLNISDPLHNKNQILIKEEAEIDDDCNNIVDREEFVAESRLEEVGEHRVVIRKNDYMLEAEAKEFNDLPGIEDKNIGDIVKNFVLWECKKCPDKYFQQRKGLARHMQNRHNEDLPKGTQAVNGIENLKRFSTIFKCDECEKIFHKKTSLNLHKHRHLLKIVPNTCQYCGKTFKKRYELKAHEITHSNEKAFLCSDCGKAFSSRGSLREHTLKHGSEPRIDCPQCPKKFFTRINMRNHFRQVHNTQKPFACETCGAAFKRPSSLRDHVSIHTGDMRFKCDLCGKAFPLESRMKVHRRTHTGEKPCKCQYCSKCFGCPGDLRRHLRIIHFLDKSYFCELCPAAFRLASELQTHFASHRHDDDETKTQNMKARLDAQEQIKIKLTNTLNRRQRKSKKKVETRNNGKTTGANLAGTLL